LEPPARLLVFFCDPKLRFRTSRPFPLFLIFSLILIFPPPLFHYTRAWTVPLCFVSLLDFVFFVFLRFFPVQSTSPCEGVISDGPPIICQASLLFHFVPHCLAAVSSLHCCPRTRFGIPPNREFFCFPLVPFPASFFLG